MSKYEEGFIGIGTYVSVLTLFALMAVCFWAFDYRRRKRFVEEATKNHEMTREQAEALYKIRGNRALLHPTNKRFRRLDVFQQRNLCSENFYQLHRWIKCLKEAKRNGQLDEYTNELIKDMEIRMHIFPLSSTNQKRLWELSTLPESTLTKFDYEQNGLIGA